jgi:hypothetical protein
MTDIGEERMKEPAIDRRGFVGGGVIFMAAGRAWAAEP